MIIENINWSDQNIYYQMALDESLMLKAIQQGNKNIIVRFYSPSIQAVTIGRSQSVADFDQEICRRYNLDIVRRITGGRAVPHYRELTYSLVSPVRGELQGNIPESYRKISICLAQGLVTSGIPVEIARHHSGDKTSLSCFAAKGKSEITFNRQKILGSAQYRKGGYLLQQGTLIYTPLPPYFDKVIPDITSHSLMDLYRSSPAARKSDVAEEKNRNSQIPNRFEIIDNILAAMKDNFSGEIINRNPGYQEHCFAVELMENKYKSISWNENKPPLKLTIKR